jgi:hypothetical protein
MLLVHHDEAVFDKIAKEHKNETGMPRIVTFFDSLGALTRAPDASFDELRSSTKAMTNCACRQLSSMRC